MLPELVTLHLPVVGELTVTSFGVMMVAAFLSGWWVMKHRLEELGRDPRLSGDIMLAALVGGLLGAKLYYLLLYWDYTVAYPAEMILSRSGLVWYGGLLGGALGVIWTVRRQGVSVPFAADLVAPALALGYGVGRIGCFLVGDDYGRPTESWVGIAFPEGSPPTTVENLRAQFGVELPAELPPEQVLAVYPTQLFEVAAGLLIFWLLWRWRDHLQREGWLFSVWLVAAGFERLFIEIFRAKDDRFFGPLTLAQVISLGLVALGGYLWHRLRTSGRDRSGEPAATGPPMSDA